MLKLLAFTLPLCLDTFAVAFAVLGEMHLTRAQRIRVWVLFIAFEAGMPPPGMALGAPLARLAGTPAHVVIDPYQLGSPNEAYQLGMVDRAHLADTVDLTFVGRYLLPIIVPVVVGALGLLMLDEVLNEDDDDDDDDEVGKARALVAAPPAPQGRPLRGAAGRQHRRPLTRHAASHRGTLIGPGGRG